MSPKTEIKAMPSQYRTWVEFIYEILFDVPPFPPNQNPGAATADSAVNCIVNEVNDCSQKNLWKFEQILKILFKNLTVLKCFFERFKENVNKHFEKLNENYNFLLLSILIAGWGLGCSLSFAIVPGFREGGSFSLPPPRYPTGVYCTVYN